MSEFLRELGYNPVNYWVFAGTTFLLWFIVSVLAGNRLSEPLNRPWIYGALLLVAMFAWRWPAMAHYKPVNPDEAQFLAGGITMLARGSIWWIDPTTSGPLVVLPLTLPGVARLPIDFFHGRLVGLLLEWGTVFCAYLILRHVHGDQKGRLLSMPLACLMIFLAFWDFVPYCSEILPVFLCALAAWLCFTAFEPDGSLSRRWRLVAGGFVLGLMPFSKIQVLPMGAAIGLATLVWIMRPPAPDSKNIGQNLFLLMVGTAAGFGVMLFSLWRSGQWNEVYQSYVVHNLHYAQARGLPWGESDYVIKYLTGISWGFAPFHYGMLALLVIGLIGLKHFAWRPVMAGWLLVIAAYCCVLVPGRLYPHYLLFLPLPLALVVGLQFGYLLEGRAVRYYAIFVAFLALGVVPQLVDRIRDVNSMHKLIASTNPRAPVTQFVNHSKKPGDSLAVWGWRPELYVETQLPQATHEAHTEAQVNEHPQRDYFRARFVTDLRASAPAFFIDSVGPDDFQLRDSVHQGHETVPELRDYIAREYSEMKLEGSFRLFLRNDRAVARQ